MCGIIGVLSDHEAAPILVEALKRLEYRGYDSAGIATINAGKLDRRLVGLVKENFSEVQQARSQAQKQAMDSYCEVSARLPLPSTDGASQAVRTR